jgi:Zn-dependent peptidase ImmA (M78 family)
MMNPTAPKPNLIRAQGCAFKLNRRFGISQPGQLPLEDLAMALGVLVTFGRLQGASARLLRKGNKGIVRVNEQITLEGARRFAIAHELGHWEQHKETSQLFLCTDADMRDYSRSVLETEANHFAAEFLMPAVLFREICANVDPSLELAKSLAANFVTSVTAAAIRLVQETSRKCILVYSENGFVRWWKRQDEQTNLWLEKDQRIHPDSMAFECFKNLSVPNQMVSVPVDAWFSHLPFRLDAEVREQSIKLGRFPGILTLLWILQ